jgi:hypothetical protein
VVAPTTDRVDAAEFARLTDPYSVHVLHLAQDRVAGVVAFREPSLFGLFGMPEVWPVPHAA